MSEPTPPEKPLKTWSHLSGQRRRPSEYEVVSTRLHYHTRDPERVWELDPNIPMAKWYQENCGGSDLQHEDWDVYRDPDEMIYRTYNIVQDGQEHYVNGLFDQFNERGHDLMLESGWVDFLSVAYTPARYLFHGLQMGSAYISQLAPASTISNCATYTTADHLRWLTHTAYRTRELANAYADRGFGEAERSHWENDPCWQGFRELTEKALVAWDWGESFAAIMLVLKPAVEAGVFEALGDVARANDDTLLGLLTQAQTRDAERHRRWSNALVKTALTNNANRVVLGRWIEKWVPLADAAIDNYCANFPGDGAQSATQAKARSARLRDEFELG